VGTLIQDIRYAGRLLRGSPGFSAVALITLALGIGANTAIFSVVNTVLLKPLPYQKPNKLVMIWQAYPAAGFDILGASPPEFVDYQDRTRVFDGVAAYANVDFNLTGAGEPDRIKGARVSGNLFNLLGVPPMLGRTINPEDDRTNGPALAVISYDLWRKQFGADKEIIGRTVRLDEKPYTVIGIMPASFRFPFETVPESSRADLWVPMDFSQAELSARAVSYDDRMIARVKDGVSLDQAAGDVRRVASEMMSEHSDIYAGKMKLSTRVSPLIEETVEKVRPALITLLGAVGFVLLIACANVANLMLARSSQRSRELAVRSAVGASTGRLMRQVLTESSLLGLLGGSLGCALAFLLVQFIAAHHPNQVPRLADLHVDTTVLVFALFVSVLTGLLFGLLPALRAARIDLNQSLKDSGRSGGEGKEKHRARAVLVVVETGAAVLLLSGAGLLVTSLLHVLQVSPGFDPNGLLVARAAFDPGRYPDPAERRKSERQIVNSLQQLPGVENVGLSVTLPLEDNRTIGFRIEGDDPTAFHQARNDLVNADYFKAMGIPLLQGRSFTDQDTPSTPLVAVINHAMAAEFWPGKDPLGRRFLWGERLFTVIGVAGDVRLSGLDAELMPAIYMSTWQVNSGLSFQGVFAVRASGDPMLLASAVRQAIQAADKELPVYELRPMTDVLGESIAERRFTTLTLAAFAGVSLLMAAIGLYGLISYAVTQRMRELGVRVALGASRGSILRLILGQGTRLVLMGSGAGIAAALLLTRLMASQLFHVKWFDPVTLASAVFTLVIAALLACYIPARRATRVDPMTALRYE